MDEDKYIVTSPPKTFYDTRQEAEEELERYINQENFQREDLKVMSLWKIE